MEATKYCGSCQSTKFVNEFNRSSSTRDGLRWECKSCNVEIWQQWRINNKVRNNEREHIRYATDPPYRIKQNMHAKINGVLRRGKYSERLEQVIGLTQVQFLEWISSNFNDNMNWSNYAVLWQFDLVIPASSFDLTVETQLLCAFNWSNIQPCLKSENAVKYNFILFEQIVAQKIKAQEFFRKMQHQNNQLLI